MYRESVSLFFISFIDLRKLQFIKPLNDYLYLFDSEYTYLYRNVILIFKVMSRRLPSLYKNKYLIYV